MINTPTSQVLMNRHGHCLSLRIPNVIISMLMLRNLHLGILIVNQIVSRRVISKNQMQSSHPFDSYNAWTMFFVYLFNAKNTRPHTSLNVKNTWNYYKIKYLGRNIWLKQNVFLLVSISNIYEQIKTRHGHCLHST